MLKQIEKIRFDDTPVVALESVETVRMYVSMSW